MNMIQRAVMKERGACFQMARDEALHQVAVAARLRVRNKDDLARIALARASSANRIARAIERGYR